MKFYKSALFAHIWLREATTPVILARTLVFVIYKKDIFQFHMICSSVAQLSHLFHS
jgi:hypothetical protein